MHRTSLLYDAVGRMPRHIPSRPCDYEEANDSLVYIRPIVMEICSCYDLLIELRDVIGACSSNDPHRDSFLCDHDRMMMRIRECMKDLRCVDPFSGIKFSADHHYRYLDLWALVPNRKVFFRWKFVENGFFWYFDATNREVRPIIDLVY